jgi:hypothetical protein
MRGAALVAGAIVIAVVVLIFILPDRNNESPMYSGGATYGRILIDSPEVYTRERMVNDRYSQEAWLLERLKKSEGTNVQGSTKRQKTTSRKGRVSGEQRINTALADRESESNGSDTADAVDTELDEAIAAEAEQPRITLIEAFRDHQSYREEVRNAIIENQLDDRHDLGGNTLYRLKFDATIIPGSDTSAWAQIMVKFGREPAGDGDQEREKDELRELYKRWMSDVQRRVNEIYTDQLTKTEINPALIYASIWNAADVNIGEDFSSYGSLEELAPLLGGMECAKLFLFGGDRENQRLILQEYSPERYECLLEAAPGWDICPSNSCEEDLHRSMVAAQVLETLGTTLGETTETKRALQSRSRRSNQETAETLQTLETLAKCDDQYLVRFEPDEGGSILVTECAKNIFAVPKTLSDDQRKKYHEYYESLPVGEEAIGEEAIGEEGIDGESTYEEETDDEILKEWRRFLSCDGEPAKIQIDGQTFDVCDPSLQELSSANDGVIELDNTGIQYAIDGQPYFTVSVGFLNFQRALKNADKKKFVFTYAITPRESSQNLASSSRLAAAEQFGADAAGGLVGAAIDIGAERSSLFSEYARIIERRPNVVGIATHANHVAHGQTNSESGGEEKNKANYLAEFGWLIGPKLVVGSNGLITYRHLPSQNSLAALVSAPSWWRRAYIEIDTAWLDDEGNVGQPMKSVKYSIALPGDIEEITSALLLGGKRPAPIVEGIEPTLLKVGEPAKILIEGQNLWRSTVVTIGAQRSKRIFVLPNMKGIIAEFDAIEYQATRPGADGDKTTVRVWTSEGVHTWETGVEVESAENPQGAGT